MDRDEYVLFIDETGNASPQDIHSTQYVVAGCAVLERDRAHLKNWSDHIKFKYWNHTNIVFHSREIGRKENEFRILGNTRKFNDFKTDLEDFLTKYPLHIFSVVVGKQEARNKGWNEVKIYQEVSKAIIENFLLFLMCQGARGKIVIESASAQKDFYFHRALGGFLASGIAGRGVSHSQVKDALTSISFVTKNNFDIEEQIADLFAYAARCQYMKQHKIPFHAGSYEDMILKVFKKKQVSKSKIKEVTKPKYLKHLNSFITLP